MKKIPYGICNYRKLQEEGYVYVDKTMYLEKLEDVGSTLVYLRPGRFGKTLFTSMMYYYYDINSKDLFETLFKDTYVYKNPTRLKNNYYILKLDFSGMSMNEEMSLEDIENEFKNKVISGINNFNKSYSASIKVNINNTPNGILIEFLSGFNNLNFDNKLYILIDEYDNFTNAILEGNGDRFKNIVGNNGFIKAFYASIKEYVGLGIVDRVFITGICPITLDSMTTGFNIATDISRDIRFTTMIGLTHNEVKELTKEIDKEKRDNIYKLMLDNYDGYLFNKDQESRSFNATLVMYFLKNYYDFNKIPDSLIDVNIAFNYGKVENLIKLYGNNYYKDILNELFKTDKISGSLKEKFNLEYDFTKDDIISLLYYFGYLTIDKITYGGIIFKIPNYIMKETYGNYFLKILRDMDIEISVAEKDIYLKELLLEGKINYLTKYIEKILAKVDNRNFIKFDEKYIELMYFTLLMENPNIRVYTEYPTNAGYIDIIIFKNSDLSKYNIMIELKYLKKSEYRKNKKLLSMKKEEAIAQLNNYSSDDRIPKDIYKYVVIFIGNKVQLIEKI